MITYQDFIKYTDPRSAALGIIGAWKAGCVYNNACDADLYDRQMNKTIMTYAHMIFTLTGSRLEDFTASNNKIASNFFHRLNTQRNTYSLGNGVSFSDTNVKEKYGYKFDTRLQEAGYYSLIHGVSFCFWNFDRLHVFKATEFAPILDENTGMMMAGVRFWQIDNEHPLHVTLYETDGYTKLRFNGDNAAGEIITPKTPYKLKVQYTPALGEEIVGGENYSALPIIPLWGSGLQQSTLVGMRSAIDSYDLVRSGFANDLSDVAQIYWIVENCGGMNDAELARFRDRLKLNHIAVADMDNSKVTPYTQEVPYNARKIYLDEIRQGIYEDFGGLDVHNISAAAKTTVEINAAYQPLDENADDFEYHLIECVQQIGNLIGIDEDTATPLFKRNRLSNQLEQVQMLSMEAVWLDEKTLLGKLPNISVDEVADILVRKDAEDQKRLTGAGGDNEVI